VIAAVALAVIAAAGPVVDDEPTPVGPAIVELAIDSGTIDGLCDAYGSARSTIDGFGVPEFTLVMTEALDAYVIVSMEGDSMRLDNEARGSLTDWLHTECVL
jgi:hypothetical protein